MRKLPNAYALIPAVERILRDSLGKDSRYEDVVIAVDEEVVSVVIEILADSLPTRVGETLCLCYGLTGIKTKMATAGVALGSIKDASVPVSENRVGQLKAKGLRMLRHPNRNARIIEVMSNVKNVTRRQNETGASLDHRSF